MFSAEWTMCMCMGVVGCIVTTLDWFISPEMMACGSWSITFFFLVEFAVDVSQLQGHAEVHFVVDVESSDQRCSFISLDH